MKEPPFFHVCVCVCVPFKFLFNHCAWAQDHDTSALKTEPGQPGGATSLLLCVTNSSSIILLYFKYRNRVSVLKTELDQLGVPLLYYYLLSIPLNYCAWAQNQVTSALNKPVKWFPASSPTSIVAIQKVRNRVKTKWESLLSPSQFAKFTLKKE